MKIIKKLILILFIIGCCGVVSLIGIDIYVRWSTAQKIVDVEEAKTIEETDYILILGAGLNADGSPSPMLKERLDKGIELYKEGISDKVIVSGDHLKEYHDEVNSMKNYMTQEGIPSDAIYMDHAGISTYDSMYRAKEIFAAKKIVVVTQKYHLYRSLYIGKNLNLEVYGVDAQRTVYNGQAYRDAREFLARIKDFAKCLVKPTSQILGETVPVLQGGNFTNDKEYLIIKSKDTLQENYINDKATTERINKIFNTYDFKDSSCKLSSIYRLVLTSGKEYDIEIDENVVHIKDRDKEIVLSVEDSKFFIELID